MPKFKVIFQRTVREIDEVVREIEADELDAAYAKANDMADEFDSNCPDDAAQVGGAECDSWGVELCFDPSANPALAASHAEEA